MTYSTHTVGNFQWETDILSINNIMSRNKEIRKLFKFSRKQNGTGT